MLSWIGLVATPVAPAPGWCELLFLDVHSFRLSFFCSLLFGCCSFSDKCMSFIRHPSIHLFIHSLALCLFVRRCYNNVQLFQSSQFYFFEIYAEKK